jgi:hypothetical protein
LTTLFASEPVKHTRAKSRLVGYTETEPKGFGFETTKPGRKLIMGNPNFAGRNRGPLEELQQAGDFQK